MPTSGHMTTFNTAQVDATGGNYTLHSYGGLQTTFVIGSGNDQIYGGNRGDTFHLGSGEDTVYAGNGNNDIYAGSGKDTIHTGNSGDTVHMGTGQDTIFANNGYHDFDFSGINHTGMTTATEDVINGFREDGEAANWIDVNQSVYSRGIHVIDSSSTTTIEQAEHLAQTSDVGHNYGAVYIANHTTGNGYLLMDNNNNGHFDSGVVLTGAANHMSDGDAHSILQRI